MLQDKDFDDLVQPVINIYNKIEMELLIEVARRFETYSSIDGSLEWYLKKLDDMKALNDASVRIFSKYSGLTEKKIKKMLMEAQIGNFDKEVIDKAYGLGLSKITYETLLTNKVFRTTLENSFMELDKTLRLIQTKAIESQKEAYMGILNKAYIDVASGTYPYELSIRKSVQEMAKKGITGITYKRNNGSLINYSIEAAVRRDVLTAVHRMANESTLESVKQLGTNYVDVSQHLGARVSDSDPIANHAGWQGKQYQVEGASEEYPNFAEVTGYGNILGFGGVNCRHRVFAFFPGISVPVSQQVDYKENKEYYENTQKLRKLERDMRSLKKQKNCMKEIDDKPMITALNRKIKEKGAEINKFCEETGLKRDYSREQVM